jgi:hypothetical protein
MKRSLFAVLLATFAASAFAANDQYRNNAGEQDFATPIAANDQYRNEAGQNDEHAPQVG